MSREDFDIPEVFRRAMEEAGWRDAGDSNGGDSGDGGGGGGDDDNGGRKPFPPRPDRTPQVNRSLWVIGIILILVLSFNWIVTTYTDWLWFTELNYASVWLKQWGVRVLSFIVGFVVAAAVLLRNWHAARRRAIRNTSPFNPQFLKSAGVGWLITGVALFLAFAFASGAAGMWEELLLYVNRTAYGVSDPIFGRDIGFYLFELPVYQFIQSWVLSLLFVTLLGVIPIYAINNLPDIQRGSWRPQDSTDLRRHVSILVGFFLLFWAAGYIFDLFGLLYSPRGVVYGATYTDMNASRWALWIQFFFMVLTAVAVFANFSRLRLRPVLIFGGLWLVATIFIGGIYPGLLQRYAVEPNEIERERPYIEHNIELTRLAFDLEKVQTEPFGNPGQLTRQDIEDSETVLRNIRLWDYRPLQTTYTQLQALRPYYQFGEIDIDRYEINGETRQVMLAPRELDKTQLPAPSWVNRNLEFTHGYGIVMNPVDRVTPDGQPEFFIQDLPPQSVVPIDVERPEVYYGEMTTDSVFVGSGREEFSYPSGDENVYSSYEGTGGVPLDNIIKRIAFAIRLGDANVLLSDEITSDTRIQFRRQIQERVREIAPFLVLDSDPYIVVYDGRLVWIQDAYTVSDRFPYATPSPSGLNYIRNSVKVVIDAYNGTVNFYVSDPDDPIIQTYDKAFPGLFRPFSAFPEGLEAHVRYPEDMFTVQAQQYLTYHMEDVRVFYNKEDLWEIPLEIFDGNEQLMEPYYVTLELRGESEPEYLLIQPFTPAGKNNMIGWMAARNDPENYGELVVYELPKQELIFGPLQVEGRIDQEPEVSEQFSLWDQRGSRVIRGNLLVVPIDDSFLYVEPIYLLSDRSALPELKRVIVASDTRIAMRETLQGALTALLSDEPNVIVVEDGTTPAPEATTPEGGGETTAPPLAADATIEELVAAANNHFEAAENAQRAGDWVTYGRELEALNQTLERLMQLTQPVQPAQEANQ